MVLRSKLTGNFFACLLLLLLVACGGGSSTHDGTPSLENPGASSFEDNVSTPVIPGEPELINGARNFPRDEEFSASHLAAQAGVDFASNQFIVFFEDTPEPEPLAQYLDPGSGGTANNILPTDNAPLVEHPYFRRVSINLAAHYELELVRRVFFRDVNFAVYRSEDITHVSQLDKLMLRVLNDNPGLVREVTYDFYVSIAGSPASEEPLGPGEYPEGFVEMMQDNPAGFRLPGVAGRTASKTVSITAPDDPYYQNKDGDNNDDGRGLWGLWRMGATHTEAWNYTTGSSDVVVAVADTGVRYTHEDLADNCIDPQNDPPYNEPGILTDVINKDNDPSDGHGHGTFCAGQVGAVGNNGKGLVGVVWDVTLLPIKVLSDGGSGSDSAVAEGMLLANYLGAHILSMSLGGSFPDRATQLAAQQCHADGMLIVVAAGNDNTSAPHYPGTYRECLCVGASTLVNSSDNEDYSLDGGELPVATRYDARAYFSNYGTWVDIAAPGRKSLSTSRSGNSAYAFGWQGTSMATPYVAGCAALLWSYMSDPSAEEIRALLQSSATEMTHYNDGADPSGFVDEDDNGVVRFCNVYEALQLYDEVDYPYDAPTISWHADNDDGDTLSGTATVKVDATPGTGASIVKVELETYARQIGVATAKSDGYYEFEWDTEFEFSRDWDVTARAYDDKGNIAEDTISLTLDNTHTAPPFDEDFTGLADNAIPADWYSFDGNENASNNTYWGADASQSGDAAPAMHSNDTSATYAKYSNDWLYMPIIDLGNYAGAELDLKLKVDIRGSDYFFIVATDNDRDYWIYEYKTGADETWEDKNYDLSRFGGGEVRIFFVLQANSNNNDPGIWIDDVSIPEITGDMPSLTINSPSNGDTVDGRVTFNVTVNEHTQKVKIEALPVDVGYWSWSITDGTHNLNWDSRQTYNGSVLVEVSAYDSTSMDGLVVTEQVALTVDNTKREPGWAEGFENITDLGGFDGSNFDGDWFKWGSTNGYWHITTDDSHSGSKAARMSKDDGSDYQANEFERIWGPVLDASSVSAPVLKFWHKLDVGDSGDYGKVVLVRYDGIEDVDVPLAEYRADVESWTEQVFDLTDYKNDSFRIKFQFDSDGDDNHGSGWLLDDIDLINAVPEITSISDNARGQGGDTRTIYGNYFGTTESGNSVTFAKEGGGETTATVNSWDTDEIEVVVPADAISGDVVVTVLGNDSNGEYFGVVPDAPTLGDLDQL